MNQKHQTPPSLPIRALLQFYKRGPHGPLLILSDHPVEPHQTTLYNSIKINNHIGMIIMNEATPNVGTEGHVDNQPQFTDEQTARLQHMVKQSVKAHGLLKQGKSASVVSRACDLPLSLVNDMANEVNQPEILAMRKREEAKRKAKRKAQAKARKQTRKK